MNAPVGYAESHADRNNHGRVETRRAWATDDVHWLGADLLALWPGLSGVVAVESARQDLGDLTGKVTVGRRYFVTSHGGLDAAFLADGRPEPTGAWRTACTGAWTWRWARTSAGCGSGTGPRTSAACGGSG